MASNPKNICDKPTGSQTAGGNLKIDRQTAGGNLNIGSQYAGLDLTIGRQAAGGNLEIGVQDAVGDMTIGDMTIDRRAGRDSAIGSQPSGFILNVCLEKVVKALNALKALAGVEAFLEKRRTDLSTIKKKDRKH